VWIKRDDAVGPALGGNKTRKLEFLFGEALQHGAQAVATFGGLQSNFARQMCAAARAAGLEPHCFYFAPRPARLEGNLLLAQVMGAHLHFIPIGGGDDGGLTLEDAVRLVRWVVRLTPRLWGKRTYFMPVGGHTAIGCLGYVLAALELDEQLRQNGMTRATIVVAAGTGGTLAGLLAGRCLANLQHQIIGIDVGKLWRGFPASIAALSSDICQKLGQPQHFTAADVPLIERTYVGAGYARPTPEGLDALRRLACEEGIVLDPVYTCKAMAGAIDLIRRGAVPPDQPVVFWHTGGVPGLWAYTKELIGNIGHHVGES
jgi:1-aminocyclopropane-1-carboxylate deaminase/D-cysteine desulfhydrase-like pyridoxal-dependent ACC family enzyme